MNGVNSMPVKLITYNLNAKGQKHAEVLAKIKSFGVWARLSESSYAIKTNLTTDQLYQHSSDHLSMITMIY